MDKPEEIIKKLAETYGKDPDKFISAIENSFEVLQDKKGNLFFEIGIFLFNLSYFKLALAVWNKALEYYLKDDNKQGEANCYGNLGIAYDDLGDFGKAIEYHKKSLGIVIEIGDRQVESSCYSNLGIVYRNLGDFNKAIEYHKKSLKIKKEIGDRAGVSRCYGNLGIAYRNLGDFRQAIDYQKKALEIAKEISDRQGESSCYGNLGNAYSSLGDYGKAIEYYEKSLEIAKKIGDRQVESRCYGNLGTDYYSLGDFNKAMYYHEKALEIAKDMGDRYGESECYAALGLDYNGLGDFSKDIEYQEKSLKMAKEIGDIDSERITTFHLAYIYSDNLNKPDLAYDYYKRSIELSESITGRLIEDEHKIGFTSQSSDAYQYMVPLCIKLEKEEEAFEYLERGKSRAFLDLLSTTEIRPSAEITKDLEVLLDKEETHLVKLREAQTRHLRQKEAAAEPGEMDKIRKELDSIYSKIVKLDPEYVFTRRGKPLSLAKLQDILVKQKRNTVLIEYFVAEDEVLIFIVSSKDKKLHIEEAPISQERLGQYIENYFRSVPRYLDFGDIGSSWLGLSRYLIDPISKYLSEGDLIYFVPYGLLHYFPLHALELNGEPIIKKHPAAYLSNASLITFCQGKGGGKLESCASFGVDPYKMIEDIVEDEAEKVAELFGEEPYIKSNAAKDKVVEACKEKDIIHFSCHGGFDNDDPLSSGVILYNKEILTAREIFDLRLNTELVTLSACETGINDRSSGDELVGLTRAFFYAGAPSAVVSLWSVEARSTQELMLKFYKYLKEGKGKAVALQKAQVDIMNKKKYSHPYYWAPFVLVGDWR